MKNYHTRLCSRCNKYYITNCKTGNICPKCKIIRTNYTSKLVKIFNDNGDFIGWIPKNKLRNYYGIDVI